MIDKFILNDKVEIPAVGLGTWQSEKPDAYNAVRAAVNCGYRHIDTAYVYENEDAVGRAVKDCGVPREQLFITTKLPSEIKSYDGAKDYCEKSLKALGLDYLDLYLIHAPWPWTNVGSDCTEGNIQAWKAMIDLKKEGKIRSIGVSNFNGEQINSLINATGVVPSINQIRFFIGNTQDAIYNYCKDNGILIEAYSPLATGKIMEIAEIREIAERLGVGLPQLCIKYCLQRGTLPLPKSVTPSRIADNLKLDFKIPEKDMELLNSIKGLFPKPYRS